MRFLRAFFIALLTALVGCVLSFFVADYLTKLLHVPEMEGQRGMTIIFLGAPLGILAGLIIGIASAILVRRQRFSGFLIAQGLVASGRQHPRWSVVWRSVPVIGQTSTHRWQTT